MQLGCNKINTILLHLEPKISALRKMKRVVAAWAIGILSTHAQAPNTEPDPIEEQVELATDEELPPLPESENVADGVEEPEESTPVSTDDEPLLDHDPLPPLDPEPLLENPVAPLEAESDLPVLEDTLPPLDDSPLEPLEQESQTVAPADDTSVETLEEQVVVAPNASPDVLSEFHFLPGETIEGAALQRLAQGTLGETLGWQPGVTAASYGQGASRPIIRGFDGFRVRLLRDSVGTLDVSASSPDHGLPLEPILLKKVEIFRGPAALMFGNSALGGAVNSTSRSFATEKRDRMWSGAIETRWDSASLGWTQAGYLDYSSGDFVLTLTGSHRDADNYRIAERARTDAYDRAFNPIVNDPTQGITVPIENPSDRLPSSFFQSSSYSVGLSWLPDDVPLHASVAFSHYNSDYGLPYIFGGDANDLFGDSVLELEQDRLDVRLRHDSDLNWLESVTFHFGYGEYEHAEFFTGAAKDLGTDFLGTTFGLRAWEGRLDVVHQPTEWLRGVAGVQVSSQNLKPTFLAAAPQQNSRFFNDFEAINFGIFANETITWKDFEFDVALRWETQEITDRSLEDFGITRGVDDSSLSLVLGGSWEKENFRSFDRLKLGLHSSLVERIPTETERFAFWLNPGIQRFLIGGDLGGTPLETERSLGLDFAGEAEIDQFSFKLNAFFYQIDDYIFLQDLRGIGNQAQYTPADARIYGLEGEMDWALRERDDYNVTFSLMGDWIRGTQRADDSPLPRIPPLRLGSRLELDMNSLLAGFEIRHAFSQDRLQPGSLVALGELPTDSYTEVNADVSYDFDLSSDNQLTVFLKGQNLLGEDRRNHTSFLKDVAPLPDRSFTLGARLEF